MMSTRKSKKPSDGGKCADTANNNNVHNNGCGDDATVVKKATAKTVPVPIVIQKPDEPEVVKRRSEERLTDVEPRTRRVSDVIDSIGDESSQPGSPRFKSFQEQQNAQVSPKSPATTPDWMNKLPDESSPGSRANDSVDAGSLREEARDKTDARPMSGGVDFNDENEDDEERRDVCAAMPVEKDSLEYNMRHPRRGKAIILNHTEFEMTGYTSREGSDIDAKNLAGVLDRLHFEVVVYNNLEHSEIKKIINNLKAEDHSDADCLLVTVLSHGIKGGYVLAKDVAYPIDFLWHSFKPDVCTTLAGKPKLFFIQACRGEKLDHGVNLMRTSHSRTQTDSASSDYKIPTFADFLVAFSTVEDHYAWRNPEKGTWFIQCLCEELRNNGVDVDLLKLLTRAARRVALDHQSFNDVNPLANDLKQVPSITTMLIRDVVFHPKPRDDPTQRMQVDMHQLEHA